MNLTILKGNLGKDPEVKTFDWGKVASFSLATTEKYKNKDGQLITETDWHTCIFRGAVCDTIEKYFHKGDPIVVIGKTRYRSYEKDGKTVYITEIKCSEFEFVGKKESEPDEKLDDNQGKWQGKKEVKSMSDINQLPGANDDLPFILTIPIALGFLAQFII